MKSVLFIFMLVFVSLNADAQTAWTDSVEVQKQWTSDGYFIYSTPQKNNKNYDPHMFKAGKYLKKSASFDALSWAFTIGAGLAASDLVFDERKSANTAGFILGALAVSFRVMAISYKYRSGTELKLSPGAVSITF